MIEDTAEIRLAVSDVFRNEMGVVPSSLNLLKGGLVNRVYAVTLPDREYVIRLDVDVLDTYHKEARVMKTAAAVGVPVPEVFAVGHHDAFDYMLMEKIEGVTGTEYKGDTLHLVREMGRLASLVNSVETEGYGFHLKAEQAGGDNTLVFSETWRKTMKSERDFMFGSDALIKAGVLTLKQFNQAAAFLAPMLDWDHLSRLSHSDIKAGNMMVRPDGSTVMIDWTQAKGSPAPYFDIGNFTIWNSDPAQEAAFVEGYGLNDAQYARVKTDCDRVGLASSLRAAAWAISVNHPQQAKIFDDAHKVCAKLKI